MIEFNREMMQNFIKHNGAPEIQRFFNDEQNIQLIEKGDYNNLYLHAMIGQPVMIIPFSELTAVFLLSDVDVLNTFSNGIILRHCFARLPIEKIEIPNHIYLISDYTFNECEILKEISIPTSVKTIGDYAFYDCEALTKITYMGTSSQWEEIHKYPKWINKDRINKLQIHCVDKTIEI